MENIEIRNIHKIKAGFVCCDVALTTQEFGCIVIKGFRIRESFNEGEIWVQEPSYQVGKNYIRTFFAENKDFWNSLKDTLINNYKKYISTPSSSNKEIIDVDEISERIGSSA